jgi:hypothetical protein
MVAKSRGLPSETIAIVCWRKVTNAHCEEVFVRPVEKVLKGRDRVHLCIMRSLPTSAGSKRA